jgi:hypothetical protein
MPTNDLSLSDRISKIRARVRTRGLGEVAGDFKGKLVNALHSEEELIFLRRSSLWTEEVPRKTNEPLALERATPDDGRDYERFIGTDSATSFAKRLTDRTSCWFVRGRGMVLHATWTTTGEAWTNEIKRYFAPPPGAAYVYESFTRAEARGLGVYPFALVEIGRRLAEEGTATMYVGVEASNSASVRAITKAGFEPVFTLRYEARYGKLSLADASGVEPELAARLLIAH